jgi:hypothetical protein
MDQADAMNATTRQKLEVERHVAVLETLVRLATRRFGRIPDATRDALAAVSEEHLLHIAEELHTLRVADALARQGWIWHRGRALLVEFVEASLPLDERGQAAFEAHMEEQAAESDSGAATKELYLAHRAYREKMAGRSHYGVAQVESNTSAVLELVLRLLTRRFGPVPEFQRQALAALPEERLWTVIDGIFELQGLDDLDV